MEYDPKFACDSYAYIYIYILFACFPEIFYILEREMHRERMMNEFILLLSSN